MANQLRVTLISTELAYIVFAVSMFCSTIVNARPLNRVAFLFCKFLLSAAVVAIFATTESSSLNSVDLALRDVIVNLVP